MVKLAPRGHMSIKMISNVPYSKHESYQTGPTSAAAADPSPEGEGDGEGPSASEKKPKNLYADGTVPCFFR
jgi:hypothetical protein